MEFKNPQLHIVSEFVPIGYQTTATSFYNYLKSLPEKRIDIKLYSLAVDKSKGIQILEYLKGKTEVEVFTWAQLNNAIQKEYLVTMQKSVQYQAMLNQIEGAF